MDVLSFSSRSAHYTHKKAKIAVFFLRSDYEGCVVVQIDRNKDIENELRSEN
jgi:hypothetical protein